MHLKTLILILLLCVSIFASAQTSNCDTIRWEPNRKLQWSDFKAVPNTALSFAAMSVPAIGYKASRVGDTLKISFVCYFLSCQSWTKFMNNNLLLQHEQTHFDIHELLKREFVKTIMRAKLKTATALRQIEASYRDINKTRNDLSLAYDQETNRSINVTEQTRWSKEIDEKIEALKLYDSNEVVIIMKE